MLRMRPPMGSLSGQKRRANASLTITTSSVCSVSVTAKSRPRSSGIPMVRKNSGVTTLNATTGASSGEPSYPSYSTLLAMLRPCTGTMCPRAAARTPGSARTSSSTRS